MTRNHGNPEARRRYWANVNYWKKVWEYRKQKEALSRGRYAPDRSVPNVRACYRSKKGSPIPKYVKAYTDDELELILNFLNKFREKARNLSYEAYTAEVERTEHYYNLIVDEINLRKEPRLRWMSKLDRECRMEISKFKSSCYCSAITNYDGDGVYATADMISDIPADPAAFNIGHIRTDFKYVCWYNK